MDENTDDSAAPEGGATPPRTATPTDGRGTFFGWMRGMRIVRQNGWIGGVCGGVAARLGIDPLIVRGIAVVIAVFGGPAFLLYAAAWLLLPDAFDRIHLEQLLRGVFEPAIVAIGVVFLFTFLPITQGFWWTGAAFWGGPHWPGSLRHVGWSAVVIAAIVLLIVWAVRRSQHGRAPRPGSYGSGVGDWRTGSAAGTPDPSGQAGAWTDAAATGTSAAAAASAPPAPHPAGPAPAAPPGPGTGAGAADYEEWRIRQQQWKQDYAAWREQNEAVARAERERRAAAMREQAERLAQQAEAVRAERRARNPRTSFVFIVIALGVALLASGIFGAIASVTPTWQDYAVPIALSVATLTMGLAMMVAGAMRRRSGFLAFVAIVLSLATVGTALAPRGFTAITIGSFSYDGPGDARVFQPAGAYFVDLDASDAAGERGIPTTIDIDQWAGDVRVTSEDPRLRVRVMLDSVNTRMTAFTDRGSDDPVAAPITRTPAADGDTWQRVDLGPAGTPDVIVRIHQGTGSVQASTTASADGTAQQGAKK